MLMIGKGIRRRAFAGVVAASAAALALLIALASVLPAALLLRSIGSGQARHETEEEAAVMKNEAASLYDPERDGEVIRLHIVANSDSSEDQRIKLLVRNEVLSLARLGDDILHPADADAAERLLKRAGEPLLAAVRAVLSREGANYDAQLMIGDFVFPEREYEGKLYPSGSYRALRILLGRAEGKNWWCILFPPLCIIRTDEPTAPSPQAAETSPEVGLNGSAPAIRFESLLVRLFNKIFNGERVK
ncbi:MAG: stage II sporulation protein R [Clostridia bacterium]|nr:stage II sporulation protein R [Clostridia bacterium]